MAMTVVVVVARLAKPVGNGLNGTRKNIKASIK